MKLSEQPEQLAYSPEELSQRTGRSTRWWRDRIREGVIATVHYGGLVMIPHSAVLEFFEKYLNRTGAPLREPPPHIKRKQEKARRAAGEELVNE